MPTCLRSKVINKVHNYISQRKYVRKGLLSYGEVYELWPKIKQNITEAKKLNKKTPNSSKYRLKSDYINITLSKVKLDKYKPLLVTKDGYYIYCEVYRTTTPYKSYGSHKTSVTLRKPTHVSTIFR